MSNATSASPSSPATNSYDNVPYPSASFPQSHPGRLAAIGRLFGLDAKAPATARVLELGCADGANLLPMAAHAPAASFVGIDASAVQIGMGRKAIEAAGLTNIELRHQDILEFPASEGKFDYIIVHGIFSWVPEPVRQKILAICSEHLTETGVAYISYNALPGWNMRRTIRDVMMFHTSAVTDPQAKVQHARNLLKFLSDAVPVEGNAHGILLKTELELISKVANNYLLHDYLEPENTSFYFHEFIGRAAKQGLQYLGEPSLSQMLATNFSESVSKALASLGNIIAQEQYMDFLRNRMFRQTLLCRSGAPLRRNVTPETLKGLAFQSLIIMQPQPADLTAGVAVAFPTVSGQSINVTDTFLKAVLQTLSENPAQVLSFADLLIRARFKARAVMGSVPANQDQIEEATLLMNLMNLYAKGCIEVWSEPVAVSPVVPEKPAVTPLARHQAKASHYVTNRLHSPLPSDASGRAVIALCDGTRTLEDIVGSLIEDVKAGRLNVHEGTTPVKDDQRLRELLTPQIKALLEVLARNAFFAA